MSLREEVRKHKTLKKVLYPFYRVARHFKRLIKRSDYKECQQSLIFAQKEIATLKEKLVELSNYTKNIEEKINDASTKFGANLNVKEDKITEMDNKITDINNKTAELSNDITNTNHKIKTLPYKTIERIDNILYYHGGSGNHGCEALVRTITKLCHIKKEGSLLSSYVSQNDYNYYLDDFIGNIVATDLDTEELKNINFSKNAVAFSIGGDNYCGYDFGTKKLAAYNDFFREKGVKTALIGCSIDPEIFEHNEVLTDLNNFSLITARETITYDLLLDHGIDRNTHLVPDSAFTLTPTLLPLPEGFKENNTIGINLSDLVLKYYGNKDNTLENYEVLIKYIIENTKYQIALIPHVVQVHNNDMKILELLYNKFKNTNRIVLIKECNCSEVKGYIKRCKMVVCARTHASIAAYSSCVPTLVLGYSTKSKGIAKDLFGTYENYVLSVENLKTKDDLKNAFIWLEQNYLKIKKHLEKIMPSYIDKCNELTSLIEDLRKSDCEIKSLPNEENCTGCQTCSLVCPNKAITMKENKEGFIAPEIDYSKCTNCDICRNACPINKCLPKEHETKFYAVKNKSKKILENSSGGGVFHAMASYVLNNGGFVYGAGFDSKNKLKHMRIDKIETLPIIMKSKYIQSDVNDTYPKVKKDLENEKTVLYCGTPCQIAGLKSYLKKEYNNLFLIDLVCHGVPNQKDFDNYCKELEKQYNSKIEKVDFRNKKDGWLDYKIKITFKNKKSIYFSKQECTYMNNFLSNNNLRKSCYHCEFNNFRNESDITLGDFWGCKEKLLEFFNDNGVSLVMTNSVKGGSLFTTIKKELICQEVSKDDAMYSNKCLTSSVDKPNERDNYFR